MNKSAWGFAGSVNSHIVCVFPFIREREPHEPANRVRSGMIYDFERGENLQSE